MSGRALTDRERALKAEARVAELEELVAAYQRLERGEGQMLADRTRYWLIGARLRGTGEHRAGRPGPVAMLTFLMDHPGTIATRHQLMNASRGPGSNPDSEPESKIVDIHVVSLRKALTRLGHGDAIRTVWGLGYTMAPVDAAYLKAVLEP